MSNVLNFPVVKRQTPPHEENTGVKACFGKRKTPPGTVRFAFDVEGQLVELERGDLPRNLLLLHNRGSKGSENLGFSGEFRLGGQLVPFYEVGQSASEVFTKLAKRTGLEKFREAFLKLAETGA